jgi:hypothetical protein
MMKTQHCIALALAGTLGAGILAAGMTAVAAPAPAAPAAGGGLQILEFKPAFDDLMTMLIQPRHIKLYYAGQQKNWTLAAFELNEMRQALGRIGKTIPKYRNFSVDATVASIIQDKMTAMDAAIKSANPAQFNMAYGELTEACNTCHQGMDHPFLVVKVPDANSYPDQDFRPVAIKK